jgi:membrane protein DedA with SNARE-associated domain
MGLTKLVVEFCANLITQLGYTGIFILMFFESMYVPIPSFAVMPFVGFAAHELANGKRPGAPEFWLGVVVGALGGLAGSLTTYYFGWWAGPVGVRKWGRYAGLIPEDLDRTHALFERRGAITVFTGRFIPVVRHFISTVAGIARMSLPPFIAMTVSGAFLWDLFLAWCGWRFQEHYYEVIHHYQMPVDIAVIIIFGGGGIYLVYKARTRVKNLKGPSLEPKTLGPDLDGPQGSP